LCKLLNPDKDDLVIFVGKITRWVSPLQVSKEFSLLRVCNSITFQCSLLSEKSRKQLKEYMQRLNARRPVLSKKKLHSAGEIDDCLIESFFCVSSLVTSIEHIRVVSDDSYDISEGYVKDYSLIPSLYSITTVSHFLEKNNSFIGTYHCATVGKYTTGHYKKYPYAPRIRNRFVACSVMIRKPSRHVWAGEGRLLRRMIRVCFPPGSE
jgi:hypothetical protein